MLAWVLALAAGACGPPRTDIVEVTEDAQVILAWQTESGWRFLRKGRDEFVEFEGIQEGSDAFVIQIPGGENAFKVPLGPLPESHPHGLPIFEEALVYQRLPEGAGPIEEVGWEALPEEARTYLYPASGCPTGRAEELAIVEGIPRFLGPWGSDLLLATSRTLLRIENETLLTRIAFDLPPTATIDRVFPVGGSGELLVSILDNPSQIVGIHSTEFVDSVLELSPPEYESAGDLGGFGAGRNGKIFFFGRRGVRERNGGTWSAVGGTFDGTPLAIPPAAVVTDSDGVIWALYALEGGLLYAWDPARGFTSERVAMVNLRDLANSSDGRLWVVDERGELFEGPMWRSMGLRNGMDGSRLSKGSALPYLTSPAGVRLLLNEKVCSLGEDFSSGDRVVAKLGDALFVARDGFDGTVVVRIELNP